MDEIGFSILKRFSNRKLEFYRFYWDLLDGYNSFQDILKDKYISFSSLRLFDAMASVFFPL